MQLWCATKTRRCYSQLLKKETVLQWHASSSSGPVVDGCLPMVCQFCMPWSCNTDICWICKPDCTYMSYALSTHAVYTSNKFSAIRVSTFATTTSASAWKTTVTSTEWRSASSMSPAFTLLPKRHLCFLKTAFCFSKMHNYIVTFLTFEKTFYQQYW